MMVSSPSKQKGASQVKLAFAELQCKEKRRRAEQINYHGQRPH
jgi:hypothetical protein